MSSFKAIYVMVIFLAISGVAGVSATADSTVSTVSPVNGKYEMPVVRSGPAAYRDSVLVRKGIDHAIAAQGTGSPLSSGDFDSSSNSYLVAYSRSGNIYGRIVDSSGNPVGSEIAVSTALNSQDYPSVVYNSSAHQYLVVWRDNRGGNFDIYGQLVNINGTLSGANFAISTDTSNQGEPAVAYNSSANQYLVVWSDYRSGTSADIYGQLIDANGSLSGACLSIFTGARDQYSGSVVYNSSTNQYFVVWSDYRNGTDYDIYGQLLNADGTAFGADFAISTAAYTQYEASAAYDSMANQYLVVWRDWRSGTGYDIYGQLVDASGTLVGSDIAICTAENEQYSPSVAYNSSREQYLVVWQDYRSASVYETYGQYLTNTGTSAGGNFFIANNPGVPDAVANTNTGNYLVTYDAASGGGNTWMIVGDPFVCMSPPVNLISWWRGDDNALDLSGASNGTLMGGATYAPGKVRQAFSFDGVDDYVDVGTGEAFNFNNGTGDFTLDAWIRLKAYPAAAAGIVGKAINESLQEPFSGWSLYVDKDGKLAFTGVGVWGFTTLAGVIPTAKWTHVAVTKSGGDYTLYVDGTEKAFLNHNAPLETSGTSLKIGTVYVATSFFHGLIDEVEIFSRALAADEIAAVYNAGSAGQCVIPMIKREPSNTYYNHFVDAFTGAQNGNNILMRTGSITEDADYNNPGIPLINLYGGYNLDFVPDPLKYSTISGSLKITNGGMSIGNIIVR